MMRGARRGLKLGELQVDGGDGDDSHRQVHVETPAPGKIIGQPAAQGGAENGGRAENGGEQALILAALDGRENIADDGEHQSEHDARAETLQSAKDDQLAHAVDGQKIHFAGRAAEGRRVRRQTKMAPSRKNHFLP